MGAPGVCTDLVVSVEPEPALAEKLEKHRGAVNAFGHEFVPIAMSIFGEFHSSVDVFLRKAFAHLSGRFKTLAILQTKRSMSEAWLVGTAAMLTGVRDRRFNGDDFLLQMEAGLF